MNTTSYSSSLDARRKTAEFDDGAPHKSTFSIVIETENLASGDFDDLLACLDSLAAQKYPITEANEVLVIDASRVDPNRLNPLAARFPWLRVHVHPEPLTYYQSKMLSAGLVTGDIVVLADSDMVYEPDWLGELLRAIRSTPDIALAGGITRVQTGGVYRFAMSLAWMLPLRRIRNDISGTVGFFANNVALRRELFKEVPIPCQLPLFRRQIAVYCQMLRRRGKRLVRQHAARGYHRPPESLREWTLRMLVLGNDMAYVSAIKVSSDGELSVASPSRWSMFKSLASGLRKRCGQIAHGILVCRKESPSQLWLLPLALPIVAACILLQSIGGLITLIKPGVVLQWMDAFENPPDSNPALQLAPEHHA